MVFRLINGDCIEKLKELPENSVDSIVSDPPYGLAFMGKNWDSFKSNDEYRQFSHDWAKEAFRVLKPGGHLLSFSGTRTYHWMAVGIEQAGFQCRDMIEWIYGCLDQDTEILTETGWKRYNEIADCEKVLSWNSSNNLLELEPVKDRFYTNYSGKMVQFKHDNVDQLLTLNHRVYHKNFVRKQIDGIRTGKYEDKYQVLDADDVKRYKIKLPMAGTLVDGLGIGGSEIAALLGWILTEGSFDTSGNGIRIYQSNSANPTFVSEIRNLLDNLQIPFKEYTRDRVGYVSPTQTNASHICNETAFFISGSWGVRLRKLLPNKLPTYDLLWNMTRDERIAFSDAAQKGDGDKNKNHFNQNDKFVIDWIQALYTSINKRNHVYERPDRPGNYGLYFCDKNDVELQVKHLKNKYVDYSGVIWCVTLKNNKAFVVRRNGKVFITGNSGFPKSHNIAKAIEKKQTTGLYRSPDVKRGVRRIDRLSAGGAVRKGKDVGADDKPNEDIELTTIEAQHWDGYGTALKPAFEPVGIFQKEIDDIYVISNNIDTLTWNILKSSEQIKKLKILSLVDLLESRETMDISNYPQKDLLGLNIVSLWNYILDENLIQENTFITKMKSNTTTYLKTLKFYLSRIIQELTIKEEFLQSGQQSIVPSVDQNLSNYQQYLNEKIKGDFVQENVIVSQLTEIEQLLALIALNNSQVNTGTTGNFAQLFVLDNIMESRKSVLKMLSVRPVTTRFKAHYTTTQNIVGENVWQKGNEKSNSPAQEPIMVAQKPISEKTIAANCLKWGVGALNIDGCRVPVDPKVDASQLRTLTQTPQDDVNTQKWGTNKNKRDAVVVSPNGRWPANIIHDNSDEVVEAFPEAKGQLAPARNNNANQSNKVYGKLKNVTTHPEPRNETSVSAARFFYCPKTSKKERNSGVSDKNDHPTVKPVELMKYLVRLVTPHNGTVLDPFMGSGSTGVAALAEGKNFIGIERDEHYFKICSERLNSYDVTALEEDEVVENVETEATDLFTFD